MELTKYKEYKIGELPAKITEFNNSLAKIKNKDEIAKTKSLILIILGRYLLLNVKGKSITDAFALEMIVEDIFVNYSFLTVQEVEFVLKNGIMGKYGLIYNDISIDTLMGVDGWFDTYCKSFKWQKELKRADELKSDPIYSGKERPVAEWYELFPILKLKQKVRDNLLEFDDIKEFYKLTVKNKPLDAFKTKCEEYAKVYNKIEPETREVGKMKEMTYILGRFSLEIKQYEEK